MSITIEAAPMAAEAQVMTALVTLVVTIVHKALARLERVASFVCPSLGSHSLSAVAPDSNFGEEQALAGA